MQNLITKETKDDSMVVDRYFREFTNIGNPLFSTVIIR